MELIAELEKEKRGVYAGAVGYFGYQTASADGQQLFEGAMDTCIALRTMMVKDGVAYLQAGGGIVFDSDPSDEYEETENKLRANTNTIMLAEKRYLEEAMGPTSDSKRLNGTDNDGKAHIDLGDGQ